MKRIAVAMGLTLALLVLVVLVGPALVPWNEFRSRVADGLAELTGRQVVIDGDLSLSLLPVPTLRAGSVRLLDQGEVLARIGAVDLRVRPWPLLAGQVRIERLALDDAEMRAILPAAGPARWPITVAALGSAVQAEGVSLTDGTLVLERPGGAVIRLTGLSGEMAAGGPGGPFELTAGGGLDGMPARLSLNAGRRTANGTTPVRVLLSLPDARADLRFTGALPAGGGETLEGDVALTSPDAGPVLRLIRHLAGDDLSGDPVAKGPPLSLRGRLALSAAAIGMDGIELQWGDSRATGSVDLPRRAGGEGSVVLAFTALDLDGLAADLPAALPWLPPAPLSLDLLADQGRWRGDLLRDLRLVGRLDGGVLGDGELAATLPGGTAVTLKGSADFSGDQPLADAALDLRSDSLRDTLAWAGLPVQTVPLERLRQATLTGRLSGKPLDFALTDARGTLDTTRFSGAVTLSRRDRLGLGLRVTLDRLDLDAYRTADAPPLWPILKPLLDGLDLTLEGKADQLALNGLPMDGLMLDAGWTGGALTLRDAAANAVAGIKVKASGHLSGRQGENSHLTLSAAGPNLAPLLRALGRPDPVLADRLGPVAVEARLVGDATRLAVDVRADALGGSAHIGGTVGNPTAAAGDGGPQLDVKVRAALPETGNLLRLALSDWRPAAPLGPMDLFATVTGPLSGPLLFDAIQGSFAAQNLTGTLTWTPPATGGDAPARLDGRLSLAALDADLLIPALTRDGAAWNLDWTRRLNGRLELAAAQLTLGGQRLQAATLPLAIGSGLIRTEGASGQWQGGAVTLDGALEQTAADPLAGDADGDPDGGGLPPLTGNLTLGVKDAALPGWLSGPVLGVKGGRFDLSLTGTGAGGTPRALLSALAGEGKATLRGAAVTGLDLAGAARRLSDGGPKGPTQLRAALRANGETAFDALSLSFALADHVAGLSGIEATGPQGRMTGAGRWSWRDRTLDLGLTLRPSAPPDAPPLGLRLAGPDQAAVRTLDLGAADDWLGKRESERQARQAAMEAAAPPPPRPAPKPAARPPAATPAPAPAQQPGDAVQGILDKLKRTP